ncbi:aminotransferase class V-fold PLP-dependent enzyme [Lentibacillus saliphilus]|uniref:aminotransferase class V-fold PLP-dependent enzyme n=1 Tax=Lentibacillus saliphilus TaxID=2737028 RepID=UPI001C2F2AE8|nr:aminotransferase class V-fold PLP-dependent enzyme [Lentibacillus saliphilus]
MIYFDQAATSFPKPIEVIDAVVETMNGTGGNPGRGTHQSARTSTSMIQAARRKAAALFGCLRPDHVLFFSNATVALNQAIKGLNLTAGDHVIASVFEHNSVRRPLVHLEEKANIRVTYIDSCPQADSFVSEVKDALKPETKAIIMTHGSNVTGDVLPIEAIAAVAQAHDCLFIVDASQTAGHIPIHMQQTGIDMLAMPGHKGLMGPQGIGMLLVAEGITLEPIHHGGTGTYSELPHQPNIWPDQFESGTLNVPAIAGLHAALELYEQRISENVPRETMLAQKLRTELKKIPNVKLYGPASEQLKLPIVAFNIVGADSQEIAMILDSHYQIAVRAGLHCSPLAHEHIKTLQTGIVRASLGVYNTEHEVDIFIKALGEIAAAYSEL